MKNYIVITSDELKHLEIEVNEKMDNGYAPFGSLVVHTNIQGIFFYYQAMLKR
jgi:hypothetical protein